MEQNQTSPQRFVTTSGVAFNQEQETLSNTPINRYSREQTLEKERAAKLTKNTTKVNQAHINAQNEIHDTACTFLQIPTAFIVTSAEYSQIRKENHPRSASLIRTEPFVNIKIVIKCEIYMFIILLKLSLGV